MGKLWQNCPKKGEWMLYRCCVSKRISTHLLYMVFFPIKSDQKTKYFKNTVLKGEGIIMLNH